jgi:hypothetical protein
MTGEWWTGLAPVELPVRCGHSEHRLSWTRGRLVALDHPDGDRERALVALGADPFPCLDILDSWDRHVDDLDVLALASRGPSDRVLPNDAAPEGTNPVRMSGYASAITVAQLRPQTSSGQASFGWFGYRPSPGRPRRGGWAMADSDDEIGRLLRLGGGLPDRLVATVIAAWAERISTGDDGVADAYAQLRAAVYGRLVSAVRDWTGGHDSVRLTLLLPGRAAEVSRDGERVRISVAFSWLRDVWSRGLATIFGQLCLSAEPVRADEWRLVTVAPDFAATRTMTITLT